MIKINLAFIVLFSFFYNFQECKCMLYLRSLIHDWLGEDFKKNLEKSKAELKESEHSINERLKAYGIGPIYPEEEEMAESSSKEHNTDTQQENEKSASQT